MNKYVITYQDKTTAVVKAKDFGEAQLISRCHASPAVFISLYETKAEQRKNKAKAAKLYKMLQK